MKIQNEIWELKEYIYQLFYEEYEDIRDSADYKSKKQDKSWVTNIDQKISEKVEELFAKTIRVISEENDQKDLSFPCIVVDPIDGTRELVREIPEFCISLSYLHSENVNDEKNYSWIFNPMTHFEVFSSNVKKQHSKFSSDGSLRGLISRSIKKKGLIKEAIEEDIFLSPMGSIALKLAFLSQGACDFVYSFRNKNIWDIAGGVHLCALAGIDCYANGRKISKLNEFEIEGPLLWAKEKDVDRIESLICRKDS